MILFRPMLVAACCSFIACRARIPQNTHRGLDLDRDKAAIIQAEGEFEQATAERGAAGWSSFFDDSATQVLAGGKIVLGTDSIRARATRTFADPNFRLSWRPTWVDISSDGTLAYTYGVWTRSLRNEDGSSKVLSTGHYVTVWRKRNGRWKVVHDSGGEDPAPATKP